MALVDQATIEVKAGKGGDGIVAFRREKFVPFGGPFGGDGGHGGSVIFRVDEGLRTLMDFRYNRHFKAKVGGQGGTKGMTGASADDLIVKVPQGTVVKDGETGEVLGDLLDNGEELVVAKGGRGGRGNIHFATPRNPAPELSENGEPGEVRKIKLELRVLADVGLVGFPSAGKSTFLSVVTGARPKIAAYHFTTLSPNLGMVKLDDDHDFVVADLPGLIEGAAQGVGLGLEFLRHIERTRVIMHLVDMSEDSGLGVSPYEAYRQILVELKNYDPDLLNRPQLIIATKMDLPGTEERLSEFKASVAKDSGLTQTPEIFAISSVQQAGTKEVLYRAAEILDELPAPTRVETTVTDHKDYEFKTLQDELVVEFDDEAQMWVVRGERLEKLYKMTNLDRNESVMRFARQLRGMGVDEKLRTAGAQTGDDVRIGDSDFVFEFTD